MATQTDNGKAFEYACLMALHNDLSGSCDVIIEEGDAFRTAKTKYDAKNFTSKNRLDLAARAASRIIINLEPQLSYEQENKPLYLSIQTDARGESGDVRDILCLRVQNDWKIGISCKHNHHAVKHSRLSDTIDFGEKWFGIPCSEEYFERVVPLFSQLREIRDSAKESGETALWSDMEDKENLYYVPVLRAFLDELKRLNSEHDDIPKLLVKYLIGKYDFYKVISDEHMRTTRVEAVNIYGTLNRGSDGHTSIVNVHNLILPNRFYHAGFMSGKRNTIEIVCDEGWSISMRIHNASSRIEPSLKFDVQLISLPSSIYAQVEPW